MHELNYLAQSHWHHFRYRLGEMIGLDRGRQEVQVAPVLDEDGNEITPQRLSGRTIDPVSAGRRRVPSCVWGLRARGNRGVLAFRLALIPMGA